MVKMGTTNYLADAGNYIDLIYIWGSVAMSLIHGSNIEGGPYNFISKFLMCLVALLAIRRTFNILRIFSFLSPIVVMLTTVVWQLRIFLTFYFILCVLFGLMFGVLGIGNEKLDGKFRDHVIEVQSSNDFVAEAAAGVFNVDPDADLRIIDEDIPGVEYAKIGLFLGNMITIMRISMGDFEIIGAV